MIGLVLLILQLVGLLTFPPLLLSIFTGKDIINLINEQNCKGKTPSAITLCKKFKEYKVNMIIIIVLYVISILIYGISLYYDKNNKKISKILLICGGIISLGAASLLIGTIISMDDLGKKYLSCDGQKKDSEGNVCEPFPSQYLWLGCSLTLLFTIIPGIIGMSNVFKLKNLQK